MPLSFNGGSKEEEEGEEMGEEAPDDSYHVASDLKLTRFHIRFFASVERGGPLFVMSMTLLPIVVNLAWVIIYFVERGNDVFRADGVCAASNASLVAIGPSPFFITSRRIPMWTVQTTFAIVNTFLWAPFRYMRRGHSWMSFSILLCIEFLTVFPFLFSMIFFPAFVAYVPTYLRVFIMKREIMFILSPDGVQKRGSKMFLIVNLALDIFAVTMTVLGLFEWSQNNFPIEPLAGTWNPNHEDFFACYSFFVCFYWFIVTLATVGYGDAIPLNTASRLVIAIFIVLFLMLLPDMLARLGAIFRLLGDLKLKRFKKAHKGNFVIVDGSFPLLTAKQALVVLQPKFYIKELHVKNLVCILPVGGALSDQEEEDEFSRLAADQSGLFCELFLLRGRLVSSDDGLERTQAKLATTIYLLPKPNLQEFVWSKAREQTRREAMAESRAFCLKRDFDQIRRIWALKNRLMGHMHGLKTVLFHQSNLKLISPYQPDPDLCCDQNNIVCLDAFEQKIAACAVLAPGFNTLVILLGISGAATDKTFVEYDTEADNELFARSIRSLHSSKEQTRQNSIRELKPSLSSGKLLLEQVSSREDAEFVMGLRHSLLLMVYSGDTDVLKRICLQAFSQRVLVLACVRRSLICRQHWNFANSTPSSNGSGAANTIKWNFHTKVKRGDYLVCFGETSHVQMLHKRSFWRSSQMQQSDLEAEDSGGEDLFRVSPTALLRTLFKEGDFSHTLSRLDLSQDVASASSTASSSTAVKENKATGGKDDGDEEEEEGRSSDTKSKLHSVLFSSPTSELHDEVRNLHERHLMDARAQNELQVEERLDYEPGRALLPQRLENHVIVYTAAHSSFVYFVKKLRGLGLEETVPILLMDSKPPNSFHWSEVSLFPDVYFLQGSPFIIDDLIRAGFEHSRSLVLLVDYRIRFQPSGFRDQENLLAEKVANRLKCMLHCPTRIVTHLVNEEHFEYIQDNEIRFMGFTEEETRLKEFAFLFQSVWSPIHSESYIAGECFFPSVFLPLFFVCETRGNWLTTFLDRLCDTVGGALHGLVLDPEPISTSIEYGELVQQRLQADKCGLVIGLFRNFTETGGRGLFRGVLLFPKNDLMVTNKDRLYVMRG
ncbi:hypothetical protein BASA81_009100 [Batrachochytrium salamandrivorans]|nr:hypothetical protein BASA81_009100 [Batrachochytrium salamandrivorans]